jgi:hypothetical protein
VDFSSEPTATKTKNTARLPLTVGERKDGNLLEITGSEAFDLLKKWSDEELTVGCGVAAMADSKAFLVGNVVGRLTNLSTDTVRVESICGPPEMRSATYLEIPLTLARFRYLEPDPEPETKLDGEISELLAEHDAHRIVESCLQVQLEKSCIVFDLLITPSSLKIESLP